MATIKDVAREASVSTATVSRVINNADKVGEKTRKLVLKVMEDLGYTPDANARALVKQKSSTLGVVIPELTDPFFASLANGIEQVARKNNMQLLLSTGQLSAESESKAINLLIEQRCEAIVVHSKMLSDDTLVKLSNRIPGLILIDRYIEAIADKCIWLDNLEGGKIAARHLLSLEHEQFACITSNYDIDDPKLRLQGFKETLQDKNLDIDSELCIAQEPTLVGGEQAAQWLLAQGKRFTSVFAYNDAMAIGAISIFEDNGYRVPEDISVVGFDDVLLSQYSRPKLTTLRYPITDMAMHAGELALSYAQQKTAPNKQKKYVPQLVKRLSVHRHRTTRR